jgi:hypothetical protein
MNRSGNKRAPKSVDEEEAKSLKQRNNNIN